MHQNIFLVLVALCLYSAWVTADEILLDGSAWSVSNEDKSIITGATVPGGIYSDLRRANILTQDLLYRDNDSKYRWVAHHNWTYQRDFEVDQSLFDKKGIFLVFHGLDTAATVWLNGHIIGVTDNMFVRYRFNVRPYVIVGKNRLKVAFESAISHAKAKNDAQVSRSYVIPPVCPPSVQHGECFRQYIRKMQASFAWDWGPAFPGVGIWKSVAIEAYDGAIVRDVMVSTIPDSPISNTWTLNITSYFEPATTSLTPSTVEYRLAGYLIASNWVLLGADPYGSARLDHSIHLDNFPAKLHRWWPNNAGPQSMYPLEARVIVGNETNTKTIRIGFRTIELVQEQIDPDGLSFYFKVNGVPIFMKGTNWIPASVLPEDNNPDTYRSLLKSARDSNMNMMRVWGGGIYEDDYFYNLADEYGILIWQDMMFACALYPTDEEFLSSVSFETIQQVRRLQRHPSLALWAANNENELAIAGMWWPEVLLHRQEYIADYVTLYVDTIRNLTWQEDISRPFLTSSPSNGKVSENEGYVAISPGSDLYGDIHHYDYFSNLWDWRSYSIPRFSSEYGVQSLPSLEAWLPVTDARDLTFPLSSIILYREHQDFGLTYMESLIKSHFKLPVSGGADRFDDYIYLSQITQAVAIKTETEHYMTHRELNVRDGKGKTMGALYWQLNDVWQAPSWSSIEYGGKWKILQYYIKKIFNPIHVRVWDDKWGQNLKVTLIRDDFGAPRTLDVIIEVYKYASLVPTNREVVRLASNPQTVTTVYEKPIAQILAAGNCSSKNECMVKAHVNFPNSYVNESIAENFWFFSSPKNFEGLPKAKVQLTAISGPRHSVYDRSYNYKLMLQTDQPALFVRLDFDPRARVRGTFSDNGFHMLNRERTVYFYADQSLHPRFLESRLTIKTLTDVQVS